MVVFAEAPAGNEHDMTVALTDIAEIERDIELAKEKENSEAVRRALSLRHLQHILTLPGDGHGVVRYGGCGGPLV